MAKGEQKQPKKALTELKLDWQDMGNGSEKRASTAEAVYSVHMSDDKFFYGVRRRADRELVLSEPVYDSFYEAMKAAEGVVFE